MIESKWKKNMIILLLCMFYYDILTGIVLH